MQKMKFMVSIINDNNYTALLLRRIVIDKAEQQEILNDLLRENKYEFIGELTFRDKLAAIQRLKEFGLVKG